MKVPKGYGLVVVDDMGVIIGEIELESKDVGPNSYTGRGILIELEQILTKRVEKEAKA